MGEDVYRNNAGQPLTFTFLYLYNSLGQKFTAVPRDVRCSKRKGLTTLRQREENETTPKTEKGGQREKRRGEWWSPH
jgi:hypothetical protein